MFISSRHKLVFLEVPRTGSRAVTRALTELDPNAPTACRRRTRGASFAYHDLQIPRELIASHLIIAAHRNPYDRTWSFWKHRRRHGNPPVFRTISWPRYVDWVCEPDLVPEIRGAMRDVPIVEMLACDTVDVWLNFEELSASWAHLQERLQMTLPALVRTNESLPPVNFGPIFNTILADKIASRFAQDFTYFGYDIESWKHYA